MRIIFLRHGEVDGNRERRYIGRTDQPLSEAGMRQAKAITPPKTDRVYSSPYLRCLQTARLVFPSMEPMVCNKLRECDFGIFEGKTADELEHCPDYRVWVDGNCTGSMPGGEIMADFKRRCCDAFEKIVREPGQSETLAFVVHGGVVMAVLERYESQKNDFFSYRIGNCETVFCNCNIQGEILLSIEGDLS